MKKLRLVSFLCACFLLGSANAALVGRLPLTTGGTDYQAYWDTALGITWLADANLAASNTFGVSNIQPDGGMRWDPSQEFIVAMNQANYLGYDQWRVPAINPINGVSYNYNFSYDGSTDIGLNQSASGSAYPGSTGSEMAHLFYTTLGNVGMQDLTGAYTGCTGPNLCLVNTGPFQNMQPDHYFAGPAYLPNPLNAWSFAFNDGSQVTIATGSGHNSYVWAVADGDIFVTTVPIPPALWLFGSGLLGLVGIARRRS